MENSTLDSSVTLDSVPRHDQPRKVETGLDPQFFQQVPHGLVNDVAKDRLKPLDVVVYIVLKKHLGQNSFTWVGNNTVARLCGVSNATVRRSMRNLQAAGHIVRRECKTGLTAKTHLRTLVVNGRSVYGSASQMAPRPTCKPSEQGAGQP